MRSNTLAKAYQLLKETDFSKEKLVNVQLQAEIKKLNEKFNMNAYVEELNCDIFNVNFTYNYVYIKVFKIDLFATKEKEFEEHMLKIIKMKKILK